MKTLTEKKWFRRLFAGTLCLWLLMGCGQASEIQIPPEEKEPTGFRLYYMNEERTKGRSEKDRAEKDSKEKSDRIREGEK